MATRSTIALEFADGTVQQIYSHWDGYLDGVGATLAEHYKDPFKVRDLIDLGDLSSLGANIGVKHNFDNPYRYGSPEYLAEKERIDELDMTTFYGRDRGETGCEARRFANVADYQKNGQQEEYDYILLRDGKWYVRCYATDGAWVTLDEAKALQEEMNKEGAW